VSKDDFEVNELTSVAQSITGSNHQIAGRNIYNYFNNDRLSIDSSPEELNELKRIANNLIFEARRRLLFNPANLLLILGFAGLMAYVSAGHSLLPDKFRFIELFLLIGYVFAMIGGPVYFIFENSNKEGRFIAIGKNQLKEIEEILRYQMATKRKNVNLKK
jgi:hypothetical protein